MKVTNPRRILYVITKASWGGAQRYVYDMATSARNKGHEVCVVIGSQGELADRLTSDGVQVEILPTLKRDVSLAAEFSSARTLYRLVRTFAPDVIHGNSSKAGALACLIGRLAGVRRIIFTTHGWAFNERRPLWQRALIWLAHYATVLLSHVTICNSRATRRDARTMPLVSHKLTTIALGIDESEYLTRDEARRLLAFHISFPIWIGCIAELHPNKQLHILIEAFSRIAPHHPDSTLVIVGEGEERVRLETLVRELGLESRVRLRGHMQDAAAYLHAFDIFVLPSHTESLGYVLLEAGRAGVACVASDVGGIPEIITHEETGLLFKSADTETLAVHMARLLDDASLRQRLGTALNQFVQEHFTKERMVSDTLALY